MEAVVHLAVTSLPEKQRIALISLIVALVLAGLKLAVALSTNSLGILFEALHSSFDLLATGLTLAAVRIAGSPADASHPYGHGKIENLSALVTTILLFLTCIWVGYEGIQRLFRQASPVVPSFWGVAVMAVSIAVDMNRSRILRRAARQFKSRALEADALHFSSDVLSSAVVLVGVLAVWLTEILRFPGPINNILTQADTVAALIVAVIILRAVLRIARENIDILMDSGSAEERTAVINAVKQVPGITMTRRVRLRSSGPQTFLDLTVGVDPSISVNEGHTLAHAAEQAVRDVLPGADVTVHVEPQKERRSQTGNPFDLVQNTASKHGLSVHNVHALRDDAGIRVEMHIELPEKMLFDEAYRRTKKFEAHLRRVMPKTEIISHIEPKKNDGDLQAKHSVPADFAEQSREAVQAAVVEETQTDNPHNFSIYEIPEQGVCISFHCEVNDGLSVHEAHNVCLRLEEHIHAKVPLSGRIIIHLEPRQAGRP
ncbi:MAG: cation-efflux pump [Desulfovibrio sp.]|nr:cation-efflux pump [Desulfovibrio sp.]